MKNRFCFIVASYFIFTSLLFFGCSKKNQKIPLINIKTVFDINWKKKLPVNLLYYYNGDSLKLKGKMKMRGGLSSRYLKHSYSLKILKKKSLCGLKADNDWIINASYIDKTFMRHKICYDLFSSFSKNNIAPKCAYFELELNGEYKGLYVLMERLDATRLKIDKKDTMAMIFNDPPIFMQDSIFFKKENKNWYEQKYPSRKKHNKYQYLNEFKNFLFNSPDSLFGDEHEGVSKWIDINNVIDWHILLLFSNNSDGIMKNFFLYKKDKDTPFRIAIWDCDHSFGRDCDNELNMMERELDCNRSVLLRRLMLINPDAYKQKLCNRWNELRDNGILTEKNFNNMISANYEIIENYIDRNFEKYPVNGKYYFDDNNFEQEIELMRKYVEMRIPYLDKYFRELAGN